MRYGCVWFDKYGDEAWASVAGSEPGRIRGVHELPSDVLWITNLDWNKIKDKGLLGHPQFRQNNFFRATMHSIAADLGLDNDGDVLERVRCISEIMHNVCTICEETYGITSFENNIGHTIRQHLLADGDLRSYGSAQVDHALTGAFQGNQKCMTQTSKEDRLKNYIFTYPRVEYAQHMLGFGVPDGAWKKIPLPEDPITYVKENWFMKPMLCKIVIKKMHDQIPSIVMPFGFDFGKSATQRAWACSPEVVHLLEYADLNIMTIFQATGYRSLELKIPALDGMLDRITYSHGIVHEATWKALATKGTPRGAWYTAWDRINMSKTAIAIAEAGFNVTWYGSGSVGVAIHTSQYKDFLKLAIGELGLVPPLNYMTHMGTL